jgi:hypothetical protein
MVSRRIMTFHGTYYVLKAEKLLKKEGISVEAIAAPRHISSDCGICIRFPRLDEERVRGICASAGLEISGVYDE